MERAGAGRGRRWSAWLAIAALLLQLGIAAGHFHAEDFGFLAGHSAATELSGGSGGPWPGEDQPGAPAHDDCALCLGVHAAGNATLPDPAVPAPPSAVFAVLVAPPEVLRLAASPYLLFRTRAPPRL